MRGQKEILVLLEWEGERRQELNAGLLLEGERLAGSLGGSLGAVAMNHLPEPKEMLEEYRCSAIYLLRGEGLSEWSAEAFAFAISVFLQQARPHLLLLAHSDRGKELAPRVAFHLSTAAVTGCSYIRVEGGSLIYVKPVYEGQLEQEITFAEGRAEIVTILPDALKVNGRAPQAGGSGRTAMITRVPLAVPPQMARVRRLDILPPDLAEVDIRHAKRLIGVGLGSADTELLGLAEELARLLQGAVGTTRPMVDDGHLPKGRMIGQTGKTVTPDLYLALGISGSPHHLAGISGSRRILSVNWDERAPIFQFSDIGFLGDLKRVLPRLIQRMKELESATG